MSSIVYLRLDSAYDPVFDPAVELTNLAAVTQAIMTRLKLFEGEWWENLSEGTPMFQSILGASGSAESQQAIGLAISQRIAGTPYVSGVQNVETKFDPVTRKFSYSAIAQTFFGSVPVSIGPGFGAALPF